MKKEATGVWVSQDGRVTPISDLADSHLNNIIPYLQRRIPLLYPNWAQDTMLLDKVPYLVALDEKCRYAFREWENLVKEARERDLSCLEHLPPAPPASKIAEPASESSTALVAAGCLLLAGFLGLSKRNRITAKVVKTIPQIHQVEV